MKSFDMVNEGALNCLNNDSRARKTRARYKKLHNRQRKRVLERRKLGGHMRGKPIAASSAGHNKQRDGTNI